MIELLLAYLAGLFTMPVLLMIWLVINPGLFWNR